MLDEQTPSQKPLAIVVDDDKDLGQVFSQALELVGFETEVVQDSRRALERIIERMPVLVSLDVQMPHVSGVDLLRQIRADERIAKIKVIMVSANGRVAEDSDIFQMADVILIKPVTFSQIKEFASRLTKG